MQGGSYLLRFKAEKTDHYEVDKWTEAKKSSTFPHKWSSNVYIFDDPSESINL